MQIQIWICIRIWICVKNDAINDGKYTSDVAKNNIIYTRTKTS